MVEDRINIMVNWNFSVTRDEAIDLWRRSQAAKGGSPRKQQRSRQVAAAAVWNGWAESVIAAAGGEDAAVKGSEPSSNVDFSCVVFTNDSSYVHDDPNYAVVSFVDGVVDFSYFKFPAAVNFSKAIFHVDVRFNVADFFHPAMFNGAEFKRGAKFHRTRFRAQSYFTGARFTGETTFRKAEFKRSTHFKLARFSGGTSFEQASAENAGFAEAIFDGSVTFAGFVSGSPFVLDRAVFKSVPNLTVTTFSEPPRVDNIVVPTAPLWNRRPNRDMAASYRALKRLAIAGHDRDREMEFFAGEMRAARFVTDFPWPGRGIAAMGRFWVGMAYDVISDFGRSVGRPLTAWIVTALLCSVFYLSEAKGVGYTFLSLFRWEACQGVADPNTSAPTEALHLAGRNGLIALYSGDDSTQRTYGCLYGYPSPDARAPYVPAWVSGVSAVQKMLSLLFIFLAGLGLRNMLKMK